MKKSISIKNVYEKIEEISKFSMQEDWDNSGLTIGSFDKEVKKVMVCLDIDMHALNEAINSNVDLIISHHPVIFNSIKNIDENSVVYKLINANISVISAHTNIDMGLDGINGKLAKLFDLEDVEPLYFENLAENEEGLGAIGTLTGGLPSYIFLQMIKSLLDVEAIKVSTNFDDRRIEKIAICGGAGSDCIKSAIDKNADILITADLKHNHYIDNITSNFNEDIILVDAGHYNTEKIFIELIGEKLKNEFKEIEIIEYRRKPYIFI